MKIKTGEGLNCLKSAGFSIPQAHVRSSQGRVDGKFLSSANPVVSAIGACLESIGRQIDNPVVSAIGRHELWAY